MLLHHLAVLCTLPLFALGAKRRATSSNFALYGYGEGFGGFPLFYADGRMSPSLAQTPLTTTRLCIYRCCRPIQKQQCSRSVLLVYDHLLESILVYSPFAVSLGADDVWVGNPNNTAVSWSNVKFYVPDDTASDKRVGFLSNDEDSKSAIETGFYFYGSTAVLIGETGELESNFFALQVSEHIHRLYWNDTSLGQVPIILRSVAPSSPPS